MRCTTCNHAEVSEGATTVTLDREGTTIVFKDVPARVCLNCGEEYVSQEVTRELLSVAEKVAEKGVEIDVRHYVAA